MNRLYLILVLFASAASFSQNALHFDGTNDYVQTPYEGITGDNPRTVEAWIKCPLIPAQHVIVDWGTFALGERFTLSLIGGFLRTEVSGSGLTGTILVADNQWHHVAVTYDPSAAEKFKTYVDGELADSFNLPTPVNTGSAVDVVIGRRVDGVNNFEGVIDEVRIWNYVRSEEEIEAVYNREFCDIPAGLVAYYKLNQGIAGGDNLSETTAFDASPALNHGSLMNFSLTGPTSNWVLGPDLLADYENTVHICEGESYTVGESTYTLDGTYTDIFPSIITGCDSVITTHLTVTFPSETEQTIVACSGESVTVGEMTYTETGIYTDILIAELGGCDSTVITNLTVLEPIAFEQTLSICSGSSVEVGGVTYTETGTYTETLTSELTGCDSTITTNLTVLPAIVHEQEFNGCEGFSIVVGDNTYSEPGVYTDELTTEEGCDSIVTTTVIINPVDVSISTMDYTISALAEGLVYQWVDCENDYEPIDGATEQIFSPIDDGNYAVIVTDGECSDTSECTTIFGLSIPNFYRSSVRLYPNPTTGALYVDFGEANVHDFLIHNVLGELVYSKTNIDDISIMVDISDLPEGLYLVTIKSNDTLFQVTEIVRR